MLDRVEIEVRAGKGGNGMVSFRHEKFVPFGGPDGGDGGSGGDVIIKAELAVSSLGAFKRKRQLKAGNGSGGGRNKRHGKKGEDLVLAVPVGTIVTHKLQIGDDSFIADLDKPGKSVVVAGGGRGGLGNTHFATSTNQAPQIAQKGEAGEEIALILEMRLIADVGIIGYPNAGKSSLLSRVSAAKPEIAGYPFTTREPILGVVELGKDSLVLAEIPGLIDGAHLGKGLGHDFLRHVGRTRILIHLVDGSVKSPAEAMVAVSTELGLFDSALAKKPQLVAVNKIDLPEVRARTSEIRDDFKGMGLKVFFISALSGEGVPELMAETFKLLDMTPAAKTMAKVPRKVFHPQPKGKAPGVQKEAGVFVVSSAGLERIVSGIDLSNPEVRRELRLQMERLGVSKALKKAGASPGDKIRCGNSEWELE